MASVMDVSMKIALHRSGILEPGASPRLVRRRRAAQDWAVGTSSAYDIPPLLAQNQRAGVGPEGYLGVGGRDVEGRIALGVEALEGHGVDLAICDGVEPVSIASEGHRESGQHERAGEAVKSTRRDRWQHLTVSQHDFQQPVGEPIRNGRWPIRATQHDDGQAALRHIDQEAMKALDGAAMLYDLQAVDGLNEDAHAVAAEAR